MPSPPRPLCRGRFTPFGLIESTAGPYIRRVVNNRKEVIQCLIVIRRDCRRSGPGFSPLTRVSRDHARWGLGPARGSTMEGLPDGAALLVSCVSFPTWRRRGTLRGPPMPKGCSRVLARDQPVRPNRCSISQSSDSAPGPKAMIATASAAQGRWKFAQPSGTTN